MQRLVVADEQDRFPGKGASRVNRIGGLDAGRRPEAGGLFQQYRAQGHTLDLFGIQQVGIDALQKPITSLEWFDQDFQQRQVARDDTAPSPDGFQDIAIGLDPLHAIDEAMAASR